MLRCVPKLELRPHFPMLIGADTAGRMAQEGARAGQSEGLPSGGSRREESIVSLPKHVQCLPGGPAGGRKSSVVVKGMLSRKGHKVWAKAGELWNNPRNANQWEPRLCPGDSGVLETVCLLTLPPHPQDRFLSFREQSHPQSHLSNEGGWGWDLGRAGTS